MTKYWLGKKRSEEDKLKMSIAAKKRKVKHCKKCGSFLGKVEHKCRPNQDSEKHWNWKGGLTMQKGYRLLMRKDHPSADRDGYVLEHRLIMEKKIGRYLKKDEVVHHINENRLDNRLENLKIMKQGQHSSQHMLGNDYYKYRK